MNEGTVFATFVIVFREALEASLIVGIILTLLNRLQARRYYSHVIGSSLTAIGLSVLVGLWLSSLASTAQETAGQLIEGLISLAAAAVLTYMFFWMERQARLIKTEIEQKVETALSRQDDWAMMSLAFFAVLREGAETVLFLKAVSLQSGGGVSWAGGLAGLGMALGITGTLFIGGKKVPLKQLFRFTGFVIVLMAAGLLAYGIHELEEAGWIPQVLYPLYNINHLLNEKQGIGSFLKALFGYNGNPSLTEVIAYWTYLALIARSVLRGRRAGA